MGRHNNALTSNEPALERELKRLCAREAELVQASGSDWMLDRRKLDTPVSRKDVGTTCLQHPSGQ